MTWMASAQKLTIFAIFALAALPSHSFSSKSKKSGATDTMEQQKTQYLIGLKSELSTKERQSFFSKHGLKEIQKVGSTPLFLVEDSKGAGLAKLQKSLAGEENVKYIEANQMYTTQPVKPKK